MNAYELRFKVLVTAKDISSQKFFSAMEENHRKEEGGLTAPLVEFPTTESIIQLAEQLYKFVEQADTK